MKYLEDLDIKLFNWGVDLGHKMLDRGYAKAWFTWLEWIILTALVYVAARRVDSGFLLLVAAISVLLLLFVALAALEKFRDEIIPNFKGGKLFVLLVTVGISLLGMWVVVNVLLELLPAAAV